MLQHCKKNEHSDHHYTLPQFSLPSSDGDTIIHLLWCMFAIANTHTTNAFSAFPSDPGFMDVENFTIQ